jgi:beta-lactamase superfamily II metal-dependent hydrolase
MGKTKNGHSVILRISHRQFTLVLGSDLNKPAEDFLLRAYSGIADGQPLGMP